MLRLVLGSSLILASAGLLVVAWWLNQPGFAGDPRVKLLDDGPFVLVVAALLAVATAGLVIALRREKMAP